MMSAPLYLVIPGEPGVGRAREGDPVNATDGVVYWMPASAGMTSRVALETAEIVA